MATRKCDCTTTKKSAQKRTSRKAEASSDNAKTRKSTSACASRTSRTKNCN